MKFCGVQIRETVGRLLYCTRLAEVAREALSIVSLILSSVWHVRRDVHQSGNGRIGSRFRNYGSPIAMRNKNARSILQSEDALGGGHILFKGRFRLLDDAHVVAVLDQNVVDAFPPGPICPRTVNQNNIPNAMLFVLR